MRNKTTFATVTTIAMLAVLSQSASAAASKQENIGVGSGAVIGAVAGGPIGFIVGAAIGATIGDSVHKRTQRISSLQGELREAEGSIAGLERGIDELGDEVTHLQNNSRPELVNLLQAGIDMDLLFRTDEFALADATGERLAQMAGTLASMADVNIQLDGFADERGDETYNHELSERRVEFVRNLLISAGVHPTRISTAAHGEAIAQDANADSFALERRVSVKLFIETAESLAANQ